MKISNLGEFGLIEHISQGLNQNLPRGLVGIGDDCAVIPQPDGRSLLVTTDLLVEGVHFLKNRISPKDLGHKALAVNISDIAAMGGHPKYAFLSMALPKEMDLVWIDEFLEGFKTLAKQNGVLLLGGDTTSTLNSIAINIALIGETDSKLIKLRSAAKQGDLICVTDCLGDSAAGLKLILEGKQTKNAQLSDYLIHRHFHPLPHSEQGLWLAQEKAVHAMIDVSDGLDSDLRRILEKSNCGAVIDLEKIPLSKSLVECAESLKWDALESAVTGGEDYCLLLTVDREFYPEIALKFKSKFGSPLHMCGEIVSGSQELNYVIKGQPYYFQKSGFDHFGSTTTGVVKQE